MRHILLRGPLWEFFNFDTQGGDGGARGGGRGATLAPHVGGAFSNVTLHFPEEVVQQWRL